MMSMFSVNDMQLSQQLSSAAVTLMPPGLSNCSIIEMPSTGGINENSTNSNFVQVTYEQYQQLTSMTSSNLNEESGKKNFILNLLTK